MIVNSLLHETEYLFRNLLSSVEQGLFLVILPVKGEVEHSNRLPEIAQLGTSCVDYAHHFVRHNEFKVLVHTMVSRQKYLREFREFTYLSAKFVTNEKAIFNLNHSYHVLHAVVVARLLFRHLLGDRLLLNWLY